MAWETGVSRTAVSLNWRALGRGTPETASNRQTKQGGRSERVTVAAVGQVLLTRGIPARPPVYHRKRDPIEACLAIVFAALAVSPSSCALNVSQLRS